MTHIHVSMVLGPKARIIDEINPWNKGVFLEGPAWTNGRQRDSDGKKDTVFPQRRLPVRPTLRQMHIFAIMAPKQGIFVREPEAEPLPCKSNRPLKKSPEFLMKYCKSLLKIGNLFGVRSLNDHGLERPQAGPQKPSYKYRGKN